MEENGSGTPAVGGFKFVATTPSPMPHQAGATPVLTWGSVDGTPLLLDMDDVGPLDLNMQGTVGGPSFHINEPTKRDELAKRLADNNSAKQAEKKRRALG